MAVADSGAEPTVIADRVNIIYKVIAGQGGKGTAATAFRRILKRQDRPTIREVHAVKDVSFTAYKGDAIGVIGRNGSGKSTLLRAVAGLLPPASGAISPATATSSSAVSRWACHRPRSTGGTTRSSSSPGSASSSTCRCRRTRPGWRRG
jgi:teichoic acid transport system ATP-binding protein